jgi:uncharacterized protein (DUF2062 family)
MVRATVKKWLDKLLHTHDTPPRTAAAFAVGVFFGFSPFLGLHTVLGLACAFAFGLNRVAVLLGIYSNLPWILPGYYAVATLLGALLLGTEVPPGLLGEMSAALGSASWRDLRNLAPGLAPLVGAYALGSTLGAIGLAIVAYRLSLAMIVAHRRHVANAHHDEPIDK